MRKVLFNLAMKYVESVIPTDLMSMFKRYPWIFKKSIIYTIMFNGFLDNKKEFLMGVPENLELLQYPPIINGTEIVINKENIKDPILVRKIIVGLKRYQEENKLIENLDDLLENNVDTFLKKVPLPFNLSKWSYKKPITREDIAKKLLLDLKNKVDSVI